MSLHFDLPDGCRAIDQFLRERGYGVEEVPTFDNYFQPRIYYREFRKWNSNLMYRLELNFEMVISDSPFGGYDANHSLTYESAQLAAYDRRMKQDPDFANQPDGPYFLPETEKLKRLGARSIRLDSLAALHSLESILQ